MAMEVRLIFPVQDDDCWGWREAVRDAKSAEDLKQLILKDPAEFVKGGYVEVVYS